MDTPRVVVDLARVIERVHDYHGIVTGPSAIARPGLGEVVVVIPNHVCPVVDLVDDLTVLTPAGVERWPVDARGRSG